ncbi:MAG: HU family DNA-binding protein [Bacteroidetes bacterium]|jgi:DNA-binding protein HU-beta|nr:HU family DNA-binding protein [Bacteroidota bacterium]
MNKKTIIDKLALRANLTKDQATKALEELMDLVTDTLENGDVVDLGGFGVFDVETVSSNTGTNPHTGQPVGGKPRKRVRFKAGADLDGSIN